MFLLAWFIKQQLHLGQYEKTAAGYKINFVHSEFSKFVIIKTLLDRMMPWC